MGHDEQRPIVRSLAVERVTPHDRQVDRTGESAFPAPVVRRLRGCERAASPRTVAVPSKNREGRRDGFAPGVRKRDKDEVLALPDRGVAEDLAGQGFHLEVRDLVAAL